jgi:hypothetical protein
MIEHASTKAKSPIAGTTHGPSFARRWPVLLPPITE